MKRSSSTDSVDNERKRSREDIPNHANMEGPSQSTQAQLCRNGCGFYGSSKNEGMCSMCYKDTVQKKNNSGRKSPAVSHILNKPDLTATDSHNDGSVANAMASLATSDIPTTTISGTNRSPSSSTVSSPIAIPTAAQPDTSLTSHSPQSSSFDAGASFEDSSPSKPKKTRCSSCRKRLGLTGFYCRCGKHFCSLHRYSDQHNCAFDYKADAQAKIRKENPVIVGEKINKI